MLKRRLITVQADRAMYSRSSWDPCWAFVTDVKHAAHLHHVQALLTISWPQKLQYHVRSGVHIRLGAAAAGANKYNVPCVPLWGEKHEQQIACLVKQFSLCRPDGGLGESKDLPATVPQGLRL